MLDLRGPSEIEQSVGNFAHVRAGHLPSVVMPLPIVDPEERRWHAAEHVLDLRHGHGHVGADGRRRVGEDSP